MTQKKKNNIIIGSLCAVVLLMVVGYAAFATQLNITGTGKITSNWNILITDIQTKNIVGGASNASDPTGKGTLTATFKTNLVSPGDSIEYDITVSNQGTLNAVLEKITLSDSNNPAIKFTTSGLTEGDALNAGDSKVLTVKVEYDNAVTSQPENTKSELTITLDYVQEGTSTGVPGGDTFTGTVYSHNITPLTSEGMPEHFINIGDTLASIGDTTEDYTTLGKKFFLKHIMVNGQVESNEVCFIKNGLHCLIGGDNGAAYETNKALLLSIFGESACRVGDSGVNCNAGRLLADAYGVGVVSAYDASVFCGVGGVGSAVCRGY